ncbi:MAG: class I tRNA ligase family protein, partial [Gemmataceae bacterium]
AIMAVPAHDERDWQFARTFNLPIRFVVQPSEEWQKSRRAEWYRLAEAMSPDNTARSWPPEGVLLWNEAYTGEGIAINSGTFNGLPTAEFKLCIIAWLEERSQGCRRVNYKLRDWLFSRQRYWGEPFPILHEIDDKGHPTGAIEPLSPDELPLRLPDLEDYKPSGKAEPPLSKATDWLYVTRNGKRYKRETNTMPQWAGSCWYYLRYIDPQNNKAFCDPQKERCWMPVDLYVGGAEHAVLHLLYSRFWHKVLYDRGQVHTPEPFQRLINQGMILGEVRPFRLEKNGQAVSLEQMDVRATYDEILVEDDYEMREGRFFKKGTDFEYLGRTEKMSKSRNNVINPDDVVNDYGADSMRLYEMFMGPLESVKPWNMRGVEGVYRFLGRVWRVFIDDRAEDMRLSEAVRDVPPEKETLRMLHRTIQRVTEDLDGMRFNTAIAAMMEFTNHLTPLSVRPRSVLEPFVLLLAPFAPHLAEELWHALDHRDTLTYEPWPAFDPALTKADEIEVPVQINGKVRLRLTLPAEIDKAELENTVLADARVRQLLEGKQVRKIIVVPGKLVNLVVG